VTLEEGHSIDVDRALREGDVIMALKTFNPTRRSLRQLVIVDRSELYKGKPVKVLTEGLVLGRPQQYSAASPPLHRGGGHKRTLPHDRLQASRQGRHPGTVERIEYDPNRSAFIALIKYQDGELAYILAPQRLAVGDSVIAGDSVDVKPGNAAPIGTLPIGTIVHNVELKIGKGGAAGAFGGPTPRSSVATRATSSSA
jgi:large subunit ribosomal protein L2